MKTSHLKELLLDPVNQEFISKNLDKDIPALILKYGADQAKRSLIEQISSRQAIRKKLPSYYQKKTMVLAPRKNLEQSSSEAIAKCKAELIKNGTRFADLSGGFGIDSRFLAPKFAEAWHIEPNTELSHLAEAHLREEIPNIHWHFEQSLAEDFLKKNTHEFDLIYLDPSRRDSNHKALYLPEEYQPNILELKDQLLKFGKEVLIKLSPMVSIPTYLKLLPEVQEIWVLSERNECKELSFLLRRGKRESSPLIRAIDIQLDKTYVNVCPSPYPLSLNSSLPLSYLYLPNSSILKAGIQDLVASDFELFKLDAFSHLYTSTHFKEGFPGRCFEVLNIHKAYDKELRGKALQVISRNFPDKPEKIQHRLKLKSKGAKDFLIATQAQGKAIFILAKWLVPSLKENGG